jgi:hypothetical protein
MSFAPEEVQVGQCYLVDGNLRRVLRIMPDGRVQYEHRGTGRTRLWKPGMLGLVAFAGSAERQVPCDWAPGNEDGHRP